MLIRYGYVEGLSFSNIGVSKLIVYSGTLYFDNINNLAVYTNDKVYIDVSTLFHTMDWLNCTSMYKYDDFINVIALIPIKETGGFTVHSWHTKFAPAYHP